jgi:lamin B
LLPAEFLSKFPVYKVQLTLQIEMSTKSSKRAAASAGATSNLTTPQPATATRSSSSRDVQSPMSPTRISRIQEKNALAGLNDRLAVYIERNQQLVQENQKINKQLSKVEETQMRTVNRLQTTYEKELVDARKFIDDVSKDKHRLSQEYDQLKKDFDDNKAKLDRKTKDYNSLQKTLSQVENELHAAQARSAQATSEKDRLAGESKDFQSEVKRLTEEMEDLRRRLDHESRLRNDLQIQIKNKNDELNLKNQLHSEEITEIRTRRTTELQEVDGRLAQEYEAKLESQLQQMRAETDARLAANKEELDSIYETKTADLKAQLKRLQSSSSSKSEEMSVLNKRVEGLSQTISSLESERNALVQKIKELEKKLDEDHSRFAKMLSDRDSEIEALSLEKSNLISDYQDLMDIKVGLDNEITTYRRLLESEEKRLSISPRSLMAQGRGGTPTGAKRGTPLRTTKRKRYEEEIMDSQAQYETSSTATGTIVIAEEDPEGTYVRLQNTGDKEISLSGWQLTRAAGGSETTHKFYRQMKLDSNAIVTVWSSDAADAVHEPPNSLVMKGSKWFAGDNIHTQLSNNSGEIVATRTTNKNQMSQSRKRLYGTQEELFQQEGDVQVDRCTIA